jgi:hypothetical protein
MKAFANTLTSFKVANLAGYKPTEDEMAIG